MSDNQRNVKLNNKLYYLKNAVCVGYLGDSVICMLGKSWRKAITSNVFLAKMRLFLKLAIVYQELRRLYRNFSELFVAIWAIVCFIQSDQTLAR